MFTRLRFEAACKAYVRHRHDWVWEEHAVLAGFGYMHRTTLLQRQSAVSDLPDSEPDDPAVAAPSPDHLICHQSVVFSSTFQVPAFYFSVHDSSACDVQQPFSRYISVSAGSPLGLSDIMHTSLLRKHALDGMEATAFSIGDPVSNFPLLSFGEHPSLGSQCWYLHPCETRSAVEEMLAAQADVRPEDSMRHVRWLEAWFLVLSCVVDLGG